MTKPTFDEHRLHAYLDDELSPQERADVEQILARDAQARAYVDGLRLLQGAFVAGLDAEAAKVPEARFEQIWDEIDRAIDRDQRLQKAPDAPLSWWARLRGALRPVLIPATAVAGAAVAVFALWGSPEGSDASPNNAPVVASNPAAATVAESVPSDIPAAPEPELVLPEPNGGPAHIQRIRWSGKSGRISEIEGKRTTTTVIWISDEDPTSSERPL